MTMSVIVCAYNEERTLAACLHSVFAQTRRPDEGIVVNNASTVTSRAHALPCRGVSVAAPSRVASSTSTAFTHAARPAASA
jgi:cellulose synthase/poly-beta-1,6-N-acetylglucosamine synthase-like glycosyltransferase